MRHRRADFEMHAFLDPRITAISELHELEMERRSAQSARRRSEGIGIQEAQGPVAGKDASRMGRFGQTNATTRASVMWSGAFLVLSVLLAASVAVANAIGLI